METTPTIQWYPGHIAKVERALQQILKQLDVVVVVVDARIPVSSIHTRLADNLRSQKPTLLVLNKWDLADPNWSKAWIDHFKTMYPGVVTFDSTTGKGKNMIVEEICRLGEEKHQQLEAKGLKRRPLRTGVVGMPNVGKSTLINTLVGKKKAKTGHRAGVTRTTQWVRIHPMVELLDTPGMIPPKLDSPETGLMLASVYSIGDATFDEESVVPPFLAKVAALYPGRLEASFNLADGEAPTLEAIAAQRNYVLPGGQLDLRRTAQAILKDYRHGRLGRMTLERP